MTRKKRTRTVGSAGPAVIQEKNVTQIDRESRERQKARKRKGLKAGSRHSDGSALSQRQQGQVRDPRLGSKKLVPLIVDTTKPTKKQRRLSAEQELEQLENDQQLLALLDRLDEGEKLGAGLQKMVDEKLDRIERLMKQLGLMDDVPHVVEEEKESKPKAPLSDDDLLDQFENMDFEGFGKE